MDVVLLHNEKAGSSDWSRKDLVKLVSEAGFRPTYFSLADALDRPKRMEKGEFVIVAGGDGAIRKTVLALLGTARPIAPLPLGTANNISRSLGLRAKPETIIAGWGKKLRRIKFDLGLAVGPWGRRYFVEGIGVGLISRMINVLDEIDQISVHEWKNAKHQLHRDACVATALAHEISAHQVTLQTDAQDRSNKFILLEILNIRRAGPAVELAPDAQPSDGQFDVVTVTERQRSRLIRTLKSRLADEKHPRNLTTRHARRVRLKAEDGCELRIDDGVVPLPAGRFVEITVDRAAVEFVVPG
jgi:diacylglycerol kinase (ATP)